MAYIHVEKVRAVRRDVRPDATLRVLIKRSLHPRKIPRTGIDIYYIRVFPLVRVLTRSEIRWFNRRTPLKMID